MGSLASAAFHVLFGWVRGIFQTLWRVIFSDGGSTNAAGGFGRNWLRWVVLLCLICTIVDLAVYFVRWKPYRVWASWFRRMKGEGIEAESLESVLYPEPETFPEDEEVTGLLYEDELNTEREDYVLPGYPDADGGIIPEEETEETTQPEEHGLFHRVAATARAIAGTDETDADLAVRYKPDPMPIKPESAYEKPVYPPSWKNER